MRENDCRPNLPLMRVIGRIEERLEVSSRSAEIGDGRHTNSVSATRLRDVLAGATAALAGWRRTGPPRFARSAHA